MVLNNHNKLTKYDDKTDPIYKLFFNISNTGNKTCFPSNVYAEMYNVDHTNL